MPRVGGRSRYDEGVNVSRPLRKISKRIRRVMPQELQDLSDLVTVPVIHVIGAAKAARLSKQVDLKLHLGCGSKLKEGWINIDMRSSADIRLDLSRKLPFKSDSAAMVYSEHFLEHIDYPDGAMKLLGECFRVLKPGGVFSVGVPDTEWPLLEYAKVRDDGYFKAAKEEWHPEWCETELEHINWHFRQGGEHKFAYDFKTLEKALARSGFVAIRRRDFDPKLDSEERRLGTLYVDATKPPTAD